MAETNAKVTVARGIDRRTRVVVVFPEYLDALSPNDRTRAIETAMWQACEATDAYLERLRLTGETKPMSAEVRAA